MSDFVALSASNLLLGNNTGTLGIQQICISPARNQAPVLHGTGIEIMSLNILKPLQGDEGYEWSLTTSVSSFGKGYSTSKTFS